MYEIYESGTVPLVVSSRFARTGGVCHGFSTRLGGVSTGGCTSMNLSFSRANDTRTHVEENYYRICRTLRVNVDRLVMSWQVHGDTVMAVDDTHAGLGWTETPPQADALITNTPGLVLTKLYADCVPVYLYDPAARAIGLVHAGWRGTIARIAQKTVTALCERYGCQPERMLAFIGPSIGPCHFEVDSPIIDQFIRVFSSITAFHSTGNPTKKKYLLDLWAYNHACLTDAGLSPANIDCASLCTYCDPTRFFSHRRDHGENGLMAAFLMLTPP